MNSLEVKKSPTLFEKFISHLYKVHRDPKKGFTLKRIKNDPILRAQVFPAFVNLMLSDEDKNYAFRIVAESFAYNPSFTSSELDSKDSFAKSFRQIEVSDSFACHIKRILNARSVKEIYDSNVFHKIVSYMSSKNPTVKINYLFLLRDLYYWNTKTKEKWIRDFYGISDEPESGDE